MSRFRTAVRSLVASVTRAGVSTVRPPRGTTTTADQGRGWLSFWVGGGSPAGNFQKDIHVSHDGLLAHWAVFTCITRIATDCSKIRIRLVEWMERDQIWTGTSSPAFSPVLAKPNGYQTRQQFIETWLLSKLSRGNTYVLKVRDNRNVVVEMHVLDPTRVRVLITETGKVFYELDADDLAQVPDGQRVIVPASEIMHDRMNCLFHPLVGISPLYACALSAAQGLMIQKNSTQFFANMSRPSGILTGPEEISDVTAERMKNEWETNYSRGNLGRVAVLGDGLKFEKMSIEPEAAQLVDQLKISGELVCGTFQVPAFKAGLGSLPPGLKVADIQQIYLNDCLQAHFEAMEAILDEGLGLDVPKDGGRVLGTEFVIEDLLKLDQGTLSDVLEKQVRSTVRSPNEARRLVNLPPVPGGESPMMQQQNYSLAALAKRDSKEDPFKSAAPAPAPAPEPEEGADDEEVPDDEAAKAVVASLVRRFTEARRVVA